MKRQSKKTSFFAKLATKSKQLIKWFAGKIPLLTVVAVALIVAVRNIDPATTYSGWDNVHPEFDLARYAQQVFFGAWQEHQNLGAPMSLGHFSEIARLPMLFFLQLLPMNLSRYVFIFLMYTTGGVGMYLYLSKMWLNAHKDSLKNWLAALGGILYLLHILTLQQFYIAFEIFTVQFAFLPLVLLSIHALAGKMSAKNIVLFLGAQLLIAPSGHTPTVLYVGALFSFLYAVLVKQKQTLFARAQFTAAVVGLTLLAHAYWLIPAFYYTAHDTHYVIESRDNALFAPESIASVREATTWSNFLKGTQYLFNWKDYSFETGQFEFIFNEWQEHLSRPQVYFSLMALGALTVSGMIALVLNKRAGTKRWAIFTMYVGCVLLIWADLFPTQYILNWLYQSPSFTEAFRNIFTKLSILYSFVSVVLFIEAVTWLALRWKNTLRAGFMIGFIGAVIIMTAWPSFEGHFLSEKLKVHYPAEYQQLFAYLKTRDADLRVLQLPQLSHAGWEYYDWQFLGAGNGYQGMGFYMFGMPQAFANRDSDRWVETSDFFYYQLKPILDAKNATDFRMFLEKYRVDLVVVDETKIDPSGAHEYAQDHALALGAGLTKVWQQDFLIVYERMSEGADNVLFTPHFVTAAATETNRTRRDVAYEALGDYLLTPDSQAQALFPFADLTAHTLTGVEFNGDVVSVSRTVPAGEYEVTLPGLIDDEYFVSAAVTYHDGLVSIVFPHLTLDFGTQNIELPRLPDMRFAVQNAPEEIVVFMNQNGVILKNGETEYPVLRLSVGQPLSVEYALQSTDAPTTSVLFLEPDWQQLHIPIHVMAETHKIALRSEFPIFTLDPITNPSQNCSQPQRGIISQNRSVTGVALTADRYAVNCNGYDFTAMSAAGSYVLHIEGGTQQGRGTKFFVNYTGPGVMPEDYLFSGQEYSEFITLWPVSSQPTETLHLNWETRSFGKESINTLRALQIAPLPLEQLARLELTNTAKIEVFGQAKLVDKRHWFGSVYSVFASCESSEGECAIGLDQSYDDGWLALSLKPFSLLRHERLNTWANGWRLLATQTNDHIMLVIFYWPELVSLGAMGLLVGSILLYLPRVR